MSLEMFVWCWIHLHPGHVLRRTAKLLGLSTLVLVPLIYLNVDLMRKGVKLSSPSTQIQTSQNYPQSYPEH